EGIRTRGNTTEGRSSSHSQPAAAERSGEQFPICSDLFALTKDQPPFAHEVLTSDKQNDWKLVLRTRSAPDLGGIHETVQERTAAWKERFTEHGVEDIEFIEQSETRKAAVPNPVLSPPAADERDDSSKSHHEDDDDDIAIDEKDVCEAHMSDH
ncbi:Hypothetical predicted protein, partial [Cloeon dipterum]